MRLPSRSPTKLLDHRLDALALPKHVTKLDKWTRAEQRENELLGAREAQAAHDAERTVGPDGRRRWLCWWQNLVSHRKRNVKCTRSRTCLHSKGAIIAEGTRS